MNDTINPLQGRDEREAFEAEMRCEEQWGHKSLARDKWGHYKNRWTACMWEVWQARAALVSEANSLTQPAPEAQQKGGEQ